MAEGRFIAYHRVSTAQQGRSGLGLVASLPATFCMKVLAASASRSPTSHATISLLSAACGYGLIALGLPRVPVVRVQPVRHPTPLPRIGSPLERAWQGPLRHRGGSTKSTAAVARQCARPANEPW